MDFCPKCKCRATGKECIYQVSHWTKNHIDSYGQQSTAQSTITSPPSAKFLRMWCAPVFLATCKSATVKKFTLENEREIKNLSNIDKNANANVSEIKIESI